MNEINQLFFELIRVSLGNQERLSRIPTAKEWEMTYRMAVKQSLLGICFAGVQRLGANADDCFSTIGMSEMLYLTWMGMAAKIQQRNETVNRQCVELQNRLSADGYRNYIMKGQSNAALYGDLQMLRQSGDIDVYLEGGHDKVLAYARTFGETFKVNELEMSVPVFDDTEVEFHYRPFIMRNPFKNRKLQRFFKDQEEACFANSLKLCAVDLTSSPTKGLEIVVPTTTFNLVHQLVHTYHHFITEGVGLRQLIDYYFVIQASNAGEVRECQRMVAGLGLNHFASAFMWVLVYVFGLKVERALWTPCEKDGRILLNEILVSGNFGHTDERTKNIQTSRWKAFWFVNGKTFRFWRFDHWAWFWSPVWRIYHFCWRKSKGFK